MKHTRRSFLTAAGLSLPAIAASRAAGSNDKVRLGFIGLGGRGMGSINWFSKVKGVDIAYLCDPDTNKIDAAKKKFPDAKGTPDLRKLIDDADIDAVVVSTATTGTRCPPSGDPGRQGRLRREARFPQRLGGAQDRRGGAQVQAHRPGRHAAAQ